MRVVVEFWNLDSQRAVDHNSETQSKLKLSHQQVRSVFFSIVFESILLLYLYDQDTNFIILIFQFATICIECWKLTRAMTLRTGWLFGVFPYPYLQGIERKGEDYDLVAIK